MGNQLDKDISDANSNRKIKNYDTAIFLYKQILNNYPISKINPDIFYRIAWCYEAKGNKIKFLENYKKAFQLNSSEEKTLRNTNIKNNIMVTANKILEIGDLNIARKYFKLLKLIKNNPEINLKLYLTQYYINYKLEHNFEIFIKSEISFTKLINLISKMDKQKYQKFIEYIGNIFYDNTKNETNNYEKALYFYLILSQFKNDKDINYKIMICYHKLDDINYINFYFKSLGSKLELENREANKNIIDKIYEYLIKVNNYTEIFEKIKDNFDFVCQNDNDNDLEFTDILKI